MEFAHSCESRPLNCFYQFIFWLLSILFKLLKILQAVCELSQAGYEFKKIDIILHIVRLNSISRLCYFHTHGSPSVHFHSFKFPIYYFFPEVGSSWKGFSALAGLPTFKAAIPWAYPLKFLVCFIYSFNYFRGFPSFSSCQFPVCFFFPLGTFPVSCLRSTPRQSSPSLPAWWAVTSLLHGSGDGGL